MQRSTSSTVLHDLRYPINTEFFWFLFFLHCGDNKKGYNDTPLQNFVVLQEFLPCFECFEPSEIPFFATADTQVCKSQVKRDAWFYAVLMGKTPSS